LRQNKFKNIYLDSLKIYIKKKKIKFDLF